MLIVHTKKSWMEKDTLYEWGKGRKRATLVRPVYGINAVDETTLPALVTFCCITLAMNYTIRQGTLASLLKVLKSGRKGPLGTICLREGWCSFRLTCLLCNVPSKLNYV